MKLTETHKKIILIVASLFGVVIAVNLEASPSIKKPKANGGFPSIHYFGI